MDHKLLQRYLSGSCTSEEKQKVTEWLDQQDEELPAAKPEITNSVSLKNELWQNLNAKTLNTQPYRPSYKLQLIRNISIAALVLLSLSTAYLFIKERLTEPTNILWKQVQTEPGKQLTITLADGSTVQLNGGSVLEYPSRFSKTSREIKIIRGEGYFNISRDIHRPFKVNTPGKSNVQVLGTQFNIKLKPEGQLLNITLIHGKIAFTTPTKYHSMKPGEQLLYDTGKQKINSTQMVDTALINAWKDGLIWFKDTPISEVFIALEQYYGVKFTYTAKVEEQTFNGKFNRKPLSEILKLIQYSTDLKFTIKGKNITVYQ